METDCKMQNETIHSKEAKNNTNLNNQGKSKEHKKLKPFHHKKIKKTNFTTLINDLIESRYDNNLTNAFIVDNHCH
jgi:hypothetical protein